MDFSGIKPYSSESSTVQDTFYSLNDDCIVVRKFVASTLDDGRRSLVQYKAGTGEWVFLFKSYFDGNLALLVEDENDADESPASHSVSASDITVTIDGVEYVPAINHGYMLIAGPFDSGCVISLAGLETGAEEPEEEVCETEEEVCEASEEVCKAEEEVCKAEEEVPEVPEEAAEEVPETEDQVQEEVCEPAEQAVEEMDEAVEQTPEKMDETVEQAPEEIIVEEEPIDVQKDLSAEESTEEPIVEKEELPSEEIAEETTETHVEEEQEAAQETAYLEEDDDLDDEENDDLEDEDDDTADLEIAAAVPASPHVYEDAEILFSESKQRYVLKIARGSGAHAILPGGAEVFARTGAGAFKGYKMRIGEKEYDLVVMNEDALNDKTSRCNAYMETLGSFRGDCCYCVDIAHPEKSGTHGIKPGTCFIDSETGYKWGKTSAGCYEFELENGNYNVYTVSSSPDGQIMSEKDIRKVSSGFLRLYSGIDEFTHISITAADAVISEDSSYENLAPDEQVTEAAYLYVPSVGNNSDASRDANVSRDAENKDKHPVDKTFKAPEFEHITLPKASGEPGKVSPFVFNTFTEADGVIVKNVPEEDDEPVHAKVSAIVATHTEDDRKNAAGSSSKNTPGESTYTPSNTSSYKKNADHLRNTLKAKNTKKAAKAAGIAAGAAILGGIIKALTGRKK